MLGVVGALYLFVAGHDMHEPGFGMAAYGFAFGLLRAALSNEVFGLFPTVGPTAYPDEPADRSGSTAES